MADRLHEPTELAEDKRRYPWKLWSARPFVVWLIYPGIDYDGEPRKMDATIRTYAMRKGLAVSISAADPDGLGRIAFCFYEKGMPRPAIKHFELFSRPSSVTPEAAAVLNPENDAPRIECVVCHAVQERPEHLSHVRECLVSGTHDKGAMFARHRPDSSEADGMRRINQFTVQWDEEEGPT